MIASNRRSLLAFAAGLVAIGSAATGAGSSRIAAVGGGAPADDPGMLASTGWLAKNLADPSVVVVQVDMPGMVMSGMGTAYPDGHIPGARELDYQSVAENIDGVSLELPPPEKLVKLFEGMGISSASRVVIIGPSLMATRVWFTMHYLGLEHVSILEGGTAKWQREGRPLETAVPTVAKGTIVAHPHPEYIATAPWVLARIGKPGISLVDTRTQAEYEGSGTRHGIQSTGHLEGARRLEWQDMFLVDSEFVLQDHRTLERLFNDRVVPGDTVVTYCYIGYRASGSYFVALLLGYPAKLFDGSYDEWSQRRYPTVTKATPLLNQ